MSSDLTHLDARTAELREKLLSSRKTHSRQNSTYIPHQVPAKEPANVSLEATDADIQDLITSITSGVGDEDEPMPPHPVRPEPSSSSSEAFSRNQQAYAANSQPPSASTTALSGNQQTFQNNQQALQDSQQAHAVKTMASSTNQQAYAANSQAYTNTVYAPSSASQELSRGQHASTADSQALQDLLKRVPDIEDWLEMTEYHNTEVRTVKLDRFRRLRDLAARKQRLEEEERKLLEEAENDTWPQQRQNKAASLVTHVQAVSETRQSLPTPITPNKPEVKDNPGFMFSTSKRAHPEEGAEQQGRDKLPRANQDVQRYDGNNVSSEETRRSEHANNRPDHLRHDTTERQSRYDTAEHPPSRRHSYREPSNIQQHPRSPPRGPRTFDNPNGPRPSRSGYDDIPHGAGETRPRYDSYKGPAARDSKRRPSLPQNKEWENSRRLDLGRRGDTRFFIVKSFNDENVQQCMEDNIWTTQAKNRSAFTEAFEQCKNVILFFSINQSGHFQGYARMLSPPSKKIPRPWWMKALPWGASEPFRLEWLSTTPIEFGRIRHIHNSLNESSPVFVGKDGQEIEPGAGAELLREMDLENERRYYEQGPQQHRGRWAHHRREDEDYHGAVVKRESSP
ncbi:YT521-B-like domain-containing protein [Apiosordaria backusii]|uniref:YT521-B-like domain-containing protein n=1 Tax=Apiosordaria backusii TaxID=314023 RepID=A0AA40EN48_9PEZI|nr:YT521-B-like domain-containing protein [Apiosordaria backusii]